MTHAHRPSALVPLSTLRRRAVRLLALALALTPGCYAAHERDASPTFIDAFAPDAGLDARLDPALDAWRPDAWTPPPCDPTRAPTTIMPCAATVPFPVIALSQPGCFVDTRATEGEGGLLTWDCMGGGAQLRFASGAAFGGSVVGDHLELCETTSYDHDCHWTSDQRITGSITTGQLAFTYAETSPGCTTSQACSANGATTIAF